MRVNFSSVATIAVALLFISGTIGCKSNGPWYDARSYSFSNPFSKDNRGSKGGSQAPLFSASESNRKPSLDAGPNIENPQGGYTSSTSLANRSDVPVSNIPPAHWGEQRSPIAQQSMQGSYTVPEPSTHSLYGSDIYAGGQGVPQQQYQSNQYQYQPEVAQHAYGNVSPYGMGEYQPTVYQTPVTQNEYPMNQNQVNIHGLGEMPGSYSPMGGMPQQYPPQQISQQYDPYNAAVPQPPQGYGGYEQPMPGAYQGNPAVGIPQQTYPPPPSNSGYGLGF